MQNNNASLHLRTGSSNPKFVWGYSEGLDSSDSFKKKGEKLVPHMLHHKSIYLTYSQNHFISVSNP